VLLAVVPSVISCVRCLGLGLKTGRHGLNGSVGHYGFRMQIKLGASCCLVGPSQGTMKTDEMEFS
jgi:hypothetical protein